MKTTAEVIDRLHKAGLHVMITRETAAGTALMAIIDHLLDRIEALEEKCEIIKQHEQNKQ